VIVLTEHIDKLGKIGVLEAPNEVAGFLLWDGRVVLVPNEAEDPTQDFQFPATAEEIEECFLVQGVDPDRLELTDFVIWHTHPNGLLGPSQLDLEGRREGVEYLVVTLTPNGPVGTRY